MSRSSSPTTTKCIVTDGGVQAFNNGRGIETITCAPYSQWQDPAERGIQTISNTARTSLIHGGGKGSVMGPRAMLVTPMDDVNGPSPVALTTSMHSSSSGGSPSDWAHAELKAEVEAMRHEMAQVLPALQSLREELAEMRGENARLRAGGAAAAM